VSGRLSRDLKSWTDEDLARHNLAKILGLVPEETSMNDYKYLYWTDNPIGNALWVAAEWLEYRSEPDHQFRWNPLIPPIIPR